MSKPSNRKQKIAGLLFLLAAPLCVIGAGAYSFFQPRLFQAATAFQLVHAEVDAPRLPDAFAKAQQQSRHDLPRLAASFDLQQSGAPDQFSITAIDANPLTAAYTANALTTHIFYNLGDASKEGEWRVKILQKAVPPKAPSFPDVRKIMSCGLSLALLFCAAGIVLRRLG